jgi:deoxyhypusine synthase
MSTSAEPQGTPVLGYDFNNGHSIENLLPFLLSTGIQSTQVGLALEILHKIIDQRTKPRTGDLEPCKIVLGFTSNQISCGMREFIRFLCEHKMVDAVVTTTGAVEEDCMKCFADHYMGDFVVDDRAFRKQGINRIANMVVPNENYCLFEDFFTPILHEMHELQDSQGINWTPSKIIKMLGQRINNETSVLYWCAKNDIPVFSPAITDGAIGDVLFFYTYKKAGFVLDVNEDYKLICDFYGGCEKKAGIILGGGTVKHHVMNSAKHSGGLDYCVVISTSENFDGSEAGGLMRDEEGKGKLGAEALVVKISGESSIIAPVLIAETFGKRKDELVKGGK